VGVTTKEPAGAGAKPQDPVGDLQTTGRIQALLAELATHLAPDEVDENGEITANRPVEGATLKEWVLVMAWDVPVGEMRLTRWCSQNLPEHHESGLLHEALNNWT
jgi:hypothetical protein